MASSPAWSGHGREVRKVVASRLPSFALHMLANDPEPEVRAIVAERALPGLAAALLRTRNGGCAWPPSATPRSNSCRR
ncbi:MAG: hypothetical protein HT580_02460 [Dechloromonas sp.]|nr:MAG: hypothetical protein HT580_02460 [Dechloromonas sp.]